MMVMPQTPNQQQAIMLAKRAVPVLVYDAVNLEGIPFTLPEVQTILDGVTVGGHKISDQNIALNQAAAWKALFRMIEGGTFTLQKETACTLHAIAGKEEALAWGAFRSSPVTIAGTTYLPPHADELDACWDRLTRSLSQHQDIYDKAINLFLGMARYQFFYDVNKRMGRFMMSGVLLSAGFPIISIPAKKQLEFNEKMIDFYNSNIPKPMIEFMKGCLEPTISDMFR